MSTFFQSLHLQRSVKNQPGLRSGLTMREQALRVPQSSRRYWGVLGFFLAGATAISVCSMVNAQPFVSSGSGFIVGTSGEILTNAHVVDGCSSIYVRLPAQAQQSATVIASDSRNDLALLRSSITPSAIASFRDGPIRSGDGVVAIGYPLAGLLAAEPNISVGIVSALAGIRNDLRFLQISAPIQPGNSGGPLFDESGRVAGIVTSGLDAVRMVGLTGDLPQNVNFAIKADIAKLFLDNNRVQYELSQATQPRSAADVGEAARAVTVYIECEKAATIEPQVASAMQSRCVEPPVPVMPDGSMAARAEIIRAAGAAKQFIILSDAYQGCLNSEFEAMASQLRAEKKTSDIPKLNAEREAKLIANQVKKEQVGAAYGATAAAYKRAN